MVQPSSTTWHTCFHIKKWAAISGSARVESWRISLGGGNWNICYFHPYLGKMNPFGQFFKGGWLKPPTRSWLVEKWRFFGVGIPKLASWEEGSFAIGESIGFHQLRGGRIWEIPLGWGRNWFEEWWLIVSPQNHHLLAKNQSYAGIWLQTCSWVNSLFHFHPLPFAPFLAKHCFGWTHLSRGPKPWFFAVYIYSYIRIYILAFIWYNILYIYIMYVIFRYRGSY